MIQGAADVMEGSEFYFLYVVVAQCFTLNTNIRKSELSPSACALLYSHVMRLKGSCHQLKELRR